MGCACPERDIRLWEGVQRHERGLKCLRCVQDELVSRISRKSINLLKDHFREDMSKENWQLVMKLKKVFNID